MKKRLLVSSLTLILAVSGFYYFNTGLQQPADNERFVLMDAPEGVAVLQKAEKKNKEGIDYWADFSLKARANQFTHDIDPKDVYEARKAHYELVRRVAQQRSSSLNIDFDFMGPSNKGGRTRDLLYDRNNTKRVYTGGVSGGLYISNDGGSTWEPYWGNDTLAGVSIVSLTQAANGDIYVGTGEFVSTGFSQGTGRSRSFIGQGIWKSSDGGNTFHQLKATAPVPSTSSATFAFVAELEAHPSDPNVILAGTAKGLKITYDGGASWEEASTALGLRNKDIQDLEVTASGKVHLTAGGKYWHGNIDDKTSYQEVNVGSSFKDAKIATAPSDENYVYLIGCNGGGETAGLYRSIDGGNTWRNIGPSTMPAASFNPTGTQGDYDMEIAVHPANKDIAYVAGQFSVYEYNYSEENGQAKDFWWPISNWWSGSSAFDPHYVHADHHRFVFHPNNPDVMIVCTDGGLFRTNEASKKYPNPPDFEQINNGYGVAQFNNIAVNLKGHIIGGTQDNGVMIINFNGNSTTQAFRASGFGDGGYVEASKLNDQAFFGSSYFGILARSSNGGDGFSSFYDNHIDGNGDRLPDAGAPFVPVSHLYEFTDMNNPNYGKGLFLWTPFDGVWAAFDALNFGSIPTWFHIAGSANGLPSAAEYTAMNISEDGNHLFVGTSSGRVYRISGLKDVEWKYNDNGTPTNPDDDFFDPTAEGITTQLIGNFSSRFVSDIAVDKNNPEHVVVALGNYGNSHYVYRSTNAVSTNNANSFSSIQNNLPKMPVYSVVIDRYDSKNIIVGTELGVYASNLNGSNWQPEFNGLPTTPVLTLNQELVYDLNGDCYILYAGTYGKGSYASASLSPSGCQIPKGNFSTGTGNPIAKLNGELSLFPNPASDQLNIRFTLTKQSDAQLLIYDMSGKVVEDRYLGLLTAGEQQQGLTVTSLKNGQYIVVLRTDDSQLVKKLSVLH